jgi:signal transduction histidine kinase
MPASATQLPPHDEERLQSLLEYRILDTDQDEQLDDLTRFTAQLFGVPIVLITIIDQNRQWFKSSIGIGVKETERSISFCQYTILQHEVFEVPDVKLDDRFIENPLVTGEPYIRYYCGAPLINEKGYEMGSLALIDHVPRKLDDFQKKNLTLLARQVINSFELARKRIQLEEEKLLLDAKVKERTHQLEIMNASKDKFFSIISHDLLGPVDGMIGSADILSLYFNQLSREEVEKFSQGVATSAKQLKQVLTNLLQWACSQTGEIPFNPVLIRLYEVLAETEKLLKETADQKKIKVDIQVKENLQLFADKNMIRVVLRNLLANAIKFSNVGGYVQISAQQLPGYTQVNVLDTGLGISKAVQEKLFRVDVKHSTVGTNNERGTGLGLILCKEFVDKHGGHIWVESQEGLGSTFSFRLPVASDSANLGVRANPYPGHW